MPAVNLPAPTANVQTRNILDGYIKIILSRYLHAEFNLTYTTNIPVGSTRILTAANLDDDQLEATLPQQIVYHLMESRKMRSKEVHYIDHPVLGVIILATPFESGDKKS